MSSERCITGSRTDHRLICLPLQNTNEYITAPEDALQIDLVPELPRSGGSEDVVTAMGVFPCNLFAYPTSNQDAKTISNFTINIMTKHAYLRTTLISRKCTAFMSHVIEEVAGVLNITLRHATTKQTQTIGLLERSHASIKQALKIQTGERRSMWHKFESIAVLNYNTSYHASFGCELSRVFDGRIPYNIPDLKMGIRPQKNPSRDSKSPKMCLNKLKWFSTMSAKIPCKLISNTKRITMKKPMPHDSNKPKTFTSYSRKQITKEAKFLLQIFRGLDLKLLKRCHRTINIW